METKEAIEILNELKNSPSGWQSTDDAINHVISKIQELESELEDYRQIIVSANASCRRRGEKSDRLKKQLSIMTSLVRTKYGNLDPRIYKEILISESLLQEK